MLNYRYASMSPEEREEAILLALLEGLGFSKSVASVVQPTDSTFSVTLNLASFDGFHKGSANFWMKYIIGTYALFISDNSCGEYMDVKYLEYAVNFAKQKALVLREKLYEAHAYCGIIIEKAHKNRAIIDQLANYLCSEYEIKSEQQRGVVRQAVFAHFCIHPDSVTIIPSTQKNVGRTIDALVNKYSGLLDSSKTDSRLYRTALGETAIALASEHLSEMGVVLR